MKCWCSILYQYIGGSRYLKSKIRCKTWCTVNRHLTDCLLIIDLTFPQQWFWIFSSAGKTPVRIRNNIQRFHALLQLHWKRSDLAAAVLSWMAEHWILEKANKRGSTHALVCWVLEVRIRRCGNIY